MKKIYYTIFLSLLIQLNGIKSVNADIVVDVSDIAQKITSIANQISKTEQNITNWISYINNIKAKGLNFVDFKNTYLGSWSIGQFSGRLVKSVDTTEQKQLELMSTKLELEETASEDYYNKKLEYTAEDIRKVDARILELDSLIPIKSAEVQSKLRTYEATPSYMNKSAIDAYNKARNEESNLISERGELYALSKKLREQYSETQKAKSMLKLENDSRYQALKKRHDELKELKKSVDTFELTSLEFDKEAEWDNKKIFDDPKYTLDDKDYEEFLNLYFYDPDDVGSGENARLELQTKRDQIGRNRKYLVINTAAHLLQVSATARREIPVRQQAIFKYYKDTIDSDNNLNQSRTYSMTRIEEAKAALILAKVLSAKLQYLAARELTEVDVVKDWKNDDKIKPNYSKFDLGRYILTKEYIKREYERKNSGKKDWKKILGDL